MMENEHTEKALRYLRNEMAEHERSEFEKEYHQNSELQATYEFHKQLLNGLALNFKREKKAMLEAMEEEAVTDSPEEQGQLHGDNRTPNLFYIGGITATAAAAIGLIIFLILPGKSAKELAKENFRPFPDYATESYRGPNDNPSQEPKAEVFNKGMSAYRASAYDKAATLLKQAIDQNQKKALSQFYLANALMASDKPEQAIQHLKGLKPKLNRDYQHQQQWYLALAYAQTGNAEKAIPILDSLTDKEQFRQKQAARTLKQALE